MRSETGKWAIITGASSGIGKALAFEFAKNGYNIFLTARNERKLAEAAREMRQRFNVEAEVFPSDLADGVSIGNLIEAVSTRKFDVLVNNAGFGVKGNFAETDIDKELKMLDVQLAAMLKLTKAVLPPMTAAKSGVILNVASVYSFAPVPMQSVYGASKAFILNFSTALQNELKDRSIQVSVLCPGITRTEFRVRAGLPDKKNSGMTAEKVARIALRETMRGRHLIVPGWQNKFFVFAGQHLPISFFATVTRFINNLRGVNKGFDQPV
jgi:short-subunit dehydrogenase